MTRLLLASAALVAGLSGCAMPAKEISFDQANGTGVVAISANTDTWPTYNRRQALAAIQQRVGPNFEIVEEREVVTGQRTQNNQQVNADPAFNQQTVSNTTTTSNVTEWWITYRRKAGPVTNTLPGMSGATIGQRSVGTMPVGAGAVHQTQFVPGMPTSGVHPAGGVIPSVQPGSAVIPAVGGYPFQ